MKQRGPKVGFRTTRSVGKCFKSISTEEATRVFFPFNSILEFDKERRVVGISFASDSIRSMNGDGRFGC